MKQLSMNASPPDVANVIATWPYPFITLDAGQYGNPNCIGMEQNASRSAASIKAAKRPNIKQITKALMNRNWRLKVSDKAEAVLWPDFWDEIPKSEQSRNAMWDAIETNSRVHVVIPSSRPDRFGAALPPYFENRSHPNVHLAAVLGGAHDINIRRVESLKNTPARSRGLWLTPEADLTTLEHVIENLNFIIAITTRADGEASTAITQCLSRVHEACLIKGVAFVQIPPAAAVGSGGKRLVLSYPFALKTKVEEADYTEVFEEAVPPKAVASRCNSSGALPEIIARRTAAHPVHCLSKPSRRPEVITAGDDDDTLTDAGPCVPPHAMAHAEGSGDRMNRFRELDDVVRNGIRATAEAGFALMFIRDEQLWRDGGHSTWNAYCETIIELGRSHVNRLIAHAAIIRELHTGPPPVDPSGNPILPGGESQTRPLRRLESPKIRAKAWRHAVKTAGGTMPTARLVEDAVAKFSETKTACLPLPLPSVRRRNLLQKLRAVAESREDWESVLKLITELEKIL